MAEKIKRRRTRVKSHLSKIKIRQNKETRRMLYVVDELRKTSKLNSDAEFCEIVNFSPQSFSQIRVGVRNAPVELISSVCNILHGNPFYIFLGIGPEVLDYSQVENKIQKESTNSNSHHLKSAKENVSLISLKSIKSIWKLEYWHEKVAYLIREIKEQEVRYTVLLHENKILRKNLDELQKEIGRSNLKNSQSQRN